MKCCQAGYYIDYNKFNMNIIHIGFPKTATTLLQQQIFHQLPNQVNYINNSETKILFYKLFNEDDSILDIQDIQAKFNTLYKQNASVNLFSHEFLTGLHHQTGFINRSLIAKRLKSVGFQKILITIRNQLDVLESAYKQYIKVGGVLKFREYFNLKGDNSTHYFTMHRFDLDYFNYFRIIKLYSDLFRFNNICVLQYEDLKKELFFTNLTNFLRLPDHRFSINNYVNQSLSKRETEILRIINHFTYNAYRPSHLVSKKISTDFFYRILKRLHKSFPGENTTYISDEARSYINAYYKNSNKNIVDEFKIILDSSYPK